MGWGASGGMGGVPRHVHMHMHTCTCTKREDKHVRKLQMATTMEAAMFIMFNMHACVCVHLRTCAHMHGGCPHPTPPPTHQPTHPPGGVPPQISKNTIRLERIEIFRFRLKIRNLWRIPHPWVDVLFGGWVGGWVG